MAMQNGITGQKQTDACTNMHICKLQYNICVLPLSLIKILKCYYSELLLLTNTSLYKIPTLAWPFYYFDIKKCNSEYHLLCHLIVREMQFELRWNFNPQLGTNNGGINVRTAGDYLYG